MTATLLPLNDLYFILGVAKLLGEKSIELQLTGKDDPTTLIHELSAFRKAKDASGEIDALGEAITSDELTHFTALYNASSLTPLLLANSINGACELAKTDGGGLLVVQWNQDGQAEFTVPTLEQLLATAPKPDDHLVGLDMSVPQPDAIKAVCNGKTLLQWKELKDKLAVLPFQTEKELVPLDDLQGLVDKVNEAIDSVINNNPSVTMTVKDIAGVRNILSTPPLDYYADRIFTLDGAFEGDIADVEIELAYSVVEGCESLIWAVLPKAVVETPVVEEKK